jgi:hypothetical protein
MRGYSDHEILFPAATDRQSNRFFGRQALFAQMNTVRAHSARHIQPIIHENRTTIPRPLNRALRQFRHFPPGKILLAQLYPIHPGLGDVF